MKRPLIAFCALSLAAIASPAGAVVLGQVDDFEDGTTRNWTVNILGMGPHPAPPANVATGGPAGADDNYLLLTSLGGQGPASRLSALNPAQWSGDYIAAGIIQITMDVLNLGATDLHLRLFVEDPAMGPPMNAAFSTNAVIVPAGSGWTSVIFSLSPADLTAAIGSTVTALSNTTILRIFHSASPNPPSGGNPGPDPITAQLGLDNITAAVPLPGAFALLALGLAGLGLVSGAQRRQ